MKKNQLLIILVLIIIIIIIGASAFYLSNQRKDIDVKVLDIYNKNNQYFLNVSIKNNQDEDCWIADMYLSTIQGSTIDITGAGAGYKIAPGISLNLTLWSAEVEISVTDPPFTFSYTIFPSGKQNKVYI